MEKRTQGQTKPTLMVKARVTFRVTVRVTVSGTVGAGFWGQNALLCTQTKHCVLQTKLPRGALSNAAATKNATRDLKEDRLR